jgi:hypothetical protein
VLVELKQFFVIFCSKAIVGKDGDLAPLARKVSKLGIQPSNALRFCSNQAKEIKLTPFLMNKVQESLGSFLISQLKESFTVYKDLSLFVQDLTYQTISSERLVDFALSLSKAGAVCESL